jgi:hypothetical protein
VIDDAGQDVGELGPGVDVVELAGLDENMAAVQWPPLSLLQNVQFPRPQCHALPRLLLMQKRPSSRKRVNARHRFRL